VLALAGCVAGSAGSFGAGPTPEGLSEQALRFAPRIALVIGNGAYSKWDPLKLSSNDATAMAATLRDAGFQLVGNEAHINVGVAAFHQLVQEMVANVRSHSGAIVVVYFSGHGFAYQGRNLLVPVDASRASFAAAAETSVELSEITQELSDTGASLSMLFLDACRDELGAEAGFADVSPPPRTFIGFGTYFGTSSHEGEGDTYSEYTGSLFDALRSHWSTIGDMHVELASAVAVKTNFEQIPVYRAAPGIAESHANIALVDPESSYARINSQKGCTGAVAQADDIGTRCASLGTLNLLSPIVNEVTHFYPGGTGSVIFGRSGSPEEALSTCAQAYNAGVRDPATIRAYSLALIAAHGSQKLSNIPIKADALLVQAAENGDGTSEALLALVEDGVIQLGGASQDESLAREHILHMAEKGQSPLSVIIGAELISERTPVWPNANFFGLHRNPRLGYQIIVHSAEQNDPLALEMLWGHLTKALGYDESTNIRPYLRAALGHPPASGALTAFTLPDFSVGQTLYAMAMADAFLGQYGPVDLPIFVRLAIVSEPFFPKFIAWGKSGGYASLVGCALVGGIHIGPQREMVVMPRDVPMARRFFQMAIDAGRNDAGQYVDALNAGQTAPCASR